MNVLLIAGGWSSERELPLSGTAGMGKGLFSLGLSFEQILKRLIAFGLERRA
jgi:hypothetical protein